MIQSKSHINLDNAEDYLTQFVLGTYETDPDNSGQLISRSSSFTGPGEGWQMDFAGLAARKGVAPGEEGITWTQWRKNAGWVFDKKWGMCTYLMYLLDKYGCYINWAGYPMDVKSLPADHPYGLGASPTIFSTKSANDLMLTPSHSRFVGDCILGWGRGSMIDPKTAHAKKSYATGVSTKPK